MTEEDPGFAALVATISSETALALVGAGSSARVGYPVWSQLADALRAEALRARPDDARRIEALARSDSDPLFLAGEYREMLGPSKYEEFIERTFGPDVTNVTQFHADLVRLPFKHVLTTNYDAVLENAHQQVFPDVPERVMWGVAQEAAAFLAELSKPSQRRKYVYLHGRYNQPASVVLTEEDYQRRYVQSSDAGARDFAVFATHPIVFIGFSGQDLDVMNRFRQVRAQGATQPRHIALLPLESDADPDIKARQLAAKYGVRPVFYTDSGDHAELETLLHKVVDAVEVERQARRGSTLEGALVRRLDSDLRAARAAFDREDFGEAVSLHRTLIDEVRAFGDGHEHSAELRRILACASVGLAAAHLSTLEVDTARETLAALDTEVLDAPERARVLRLLVRVGDDARAVHLLERSGTGEEYDAVRQFLSLKRGAVPEDLKTVDWLQIEASLFALHQNNFELAAHCAMTAVGVTERKVIKSSAFQLLVAALIGSVRGLEGAIPVPLEARRDVVIRIEQLAEEVLGARLPNGIMKAIHSSLLQYAIETGNRVGFERAISELRVLDPAVIQEDANFKRAVEIASSGDAVTAASELGSDAPDWWLRLQRVALYNAAGQPDEAAREAVAIARDYPGYATVEHEAASALLRKGELAAALTHARRAYELLPGIGQQLTLAQCLLGHQQHAAAAALMESIPGRRTPEALRVKALATEPSDPAAAVVLWNEYLSFNRADARARAHVATLLYALGRTREAAKEAWKACTEPGADKLPPEALYQSALLQRIGLESREVAYERAHKIAETLKARRETEPDADQAFMQLFFEMGSPEDLPAPDLERLASLGLVKQVTLEEVKQHVRRSVERQTALWRLLEGGALTLTHYSQLASIPIASLVAFASKRRAPLPTPSWTPVSEPVDLARTTVLTGSLELLLLHELGALNHLKSKLEQGCRLLLFHDIAEAIASDVLELGHRDHPEALSRHKALWEMVSRSARFHRNGDGDQSESEWALKASLTLIEPAELSNPRSTAAFVKWLVSKGIIERSLADRYWRRVGAPSVSPEIGDSGVALAWTSLVELYEAGILATVLERAGFEVHVSPHSTQALEARITELEIAADALYRAQLVQVFVGEGLEKKWISLIPRPEAAELPQLKNSEAPVVLREGLTNAISWRSALLTRPELLLFSCDPLVNGIFSATASAEVMSQFQWTPESYLAIANTMRFVGERMMSISAVLASLGKADWVERRRLAELGFVAAVKPEDLVSLAGEYGDLAKPTPRTFLDLLELPAKSGGPGARMSGIELAQRYCGAIWSGLTRDVPDGVDGSVLAHTLLDRLAAVDIPVKRPLQFAMRLLALHAASKPADAFEENAEGKHQFSAASRTGNAWRALFAWAQERDTRYVAALWRGVTEALLDLDKAHAGRSFRAAPLLLAHVVGPKSGPPWSLADELVPLATLSANWDDRPLQWLIIGADEKDDGLRPEHVLDEAAGALERNPDSLESDGTSWHFEARTSAGLEVDVVIAPETLLLRATEGPCSNGSRQSACEQGVHDGKAYELLQGLAASPSSSDARTAVARRAAGSPWRAVRRDPSFILLWGVTEAGPLAASTREELEALLSEARDLSTAESIDDVIGSRARSGRWHSRPDRSLLVQEALRSLWPLSVQTATARLRSSERADLARRAIERLSDSGGVYWAELAADLLFVLLEGESPQEEGRPGYGATPEERAALVEAVLNETVMPSDGTFGSVEHGMILECGSAVARVCGPWLQLKDFVWLSHRLARWTYAQVVRASESSIREAYTVFDAAAKQDSPSHEGQRDVLDPRWCGPAGRNLRLMGVLSAVEIALQPASVALALGGEGWSPPPKLTPRTKALLAELAARPFSEDDKLIRASPNAAALLSWGGKATVQDLALSVLLLDDHGGWLLLPKPARESWIAQLPPLLTEERASAPRDLLRNVIFAAAATLDSVDASEASALERRVAADGWPPDWVSVRFLAAVGLLNAGRDAREVVVRMLPDAVRSSEGRRALPLVFKIWSERGWDDSNRLLSEMLNAMKMQGADEVEVLLEMEPLLESLDVRVANAAFACISDTLQQERFASEPRLQGLRERARRVTV